MLRAIAMIAAATLCALSIAGAQVPGPTPRPVIDSGKESPDARNACRSRSGIATLGEYERIAVLCPDSLELGAVHDLTDLLSSRIPGVLVQETSGTTGTAARIRIRGPGSILLDNEPIFIVDGVRVLGSPVKTYILSPQLPSRLDDIRVEDIAMVEVLHGPATTALHGSGAAAGVIRITTRRGTVGLPRWNVVAAMGPVHEATRYPENYSQSGTYPSGFAASNCTLIAQGQGRCTPDATPPASYSPLDQDSPFRSGVRQDYGASVMGGTPILRYYAATGRSREDGILDHSALGRHHVRLNLDARPLGNLRIGLQSAYLSGDAEFREEEIGRHHVLYSGLMGYATATGSPSGYLYGDPDTALRTTLGQEVGRLQAGLSAEWTPLRGLAFTAGGGVDRTNTVELERAPYRYPSPGEVRERATMESGNMTAGIHAVASYPLSATLSASSRVGIHHDEANLRREWGSVYNDGRWNSAFRKHEWSTTGIYLAQRLSWNARVHASAGLREDYFGGDREGPSPVAKSAALSWLVRRAPSAGSPSRVGLLRVHLAYGSVAGVRFPVDFARIVGPEFPLDRMTSTSEVEWNTELVAGIAASFLDERFDISLSHYAKRMTKGFAVSTASGGYRSNAPTILLNPAEVRNAGFEGLVRAGIVDNGAVTLEATLGASTNSNEVVSLPTSGQYPGHQTPVAGYPLGGFWGSAIRSYQDLDGDGLLESGCYPSVELIGLPPCEVVLVGGRYLGSSIPKVELFLAPTLALHRRLTISALVDYRGGFKQFNDTEAERCWRGRCRAAVHPGTTLEEQARVVAVNSFARGGYVEDATFAKLRELAVSVSAPQAWANRIGGRGAKISLAGRNLATWTRYSGLDPEINSAGPLGSAQREFFTQPPVRYYTARVALTW